MTPRIIRTVGAVILAMVIYFVARIITGTAASMSYWEQRYPGLWSRDYPVAQVVITCALVLAEGAVWWRLFVASRGELWLRALLATGSGLVGVMLVGVLAFELHSPPRVTYHIRWLSLVTSLSFITCVVSAVAKIARWPA